MLFEKKETDLRARVGNVLRAKKTVDAISVRHVEISPKALSVLSCYRQRRGENEAGGILIGSRLPDLLRIEQVTEPGPNDRSGPTFFERDAVSAQRAINEAWNTSGGTQLYLGEWHTHPETHPHPSRRDHKMIVDMFQGTQPRHGPLILLIVGTHGFWLGCQSSGLTLYQVKSFSSKITASGNSSSISKF